MMSCERHEYVINICKGCGQDHFFCVCWQTLMDALNRIIFIKSKLDIYKCPVIKTNHVKVDFIRKILSCISGMKGINLLKRLDKR